MEAVVGVADIKNIASVKILAKLMDFADESYNDELNCTDRAYRMDQQTWLTMN